MKFINPLSEEKKYSDKERENIFFEDYIYRNVPKPNPKTYEFLKKYPFEELYKLNQLPCIPEKDIKKFQIEKNGKIEVFKGINTLVIEDAKIYKAMDLFPSIEMDIDYRKKTCKYSYMVWKYF